MCLFNLAKNALNFAKNGAKVLKIREIKSGAKEKCRARKTLKNAALDAKIGVDTAENEPRKGSEKCIL